MYTIQQLIDKLNTYDNKEMLVMVDGYEGGFQPIEDDSFEFNKVKSNIGTAWYNGDYDYCSNDEVGVEALIIGR
jgi:hypothetical protein